MGKYIFVDTMIFLHYKPIEEIDLADILGVDKVIILIPRITLRELDEQKNTNKQNRIRERAKKVLQRLEKWMKSGEPIRPGVNVNYYGSIPKIDFEKHGLNPNWNDDILLATILQYQQDNSSADICLISQDTGPRFTAQHLSIPAFELPGKFKLPVTLDPIEQENRELRRTIAKLQSPLPQLVVCFAESEPPETHARFLLQVSPKPMEEKIEEKLAQLRKKLPKRYPPAPKERDTTAGIAAVLSAFHSLLPIPPEEYDRYNRDVDQFLCEYERYIRGTWGLKDVAQRTIRFQIEIRNIGSAPADDIDVYFHFHDGFQVITEEKLQPLPQEPEPPVEPRTQAQMLVEAVDRFRSSPGLVMPRPFSREVSHPTSFKLKRTDSYELTDHFERIKHGDSMLLPEIFLTFDSYETAKSFSCEYTIRPANLPEPVSGCLNFVIEKKEEC